MSGPDDDETRVRPVRPRYFVGIAFLWLILVGCAVLVVVGLVALFSGDGTGNDVIALVIGVGGLWYVYPELRMVIRRHRAAREAPPQ